eukprot:364766-Chlamydomonas_euryale.AAC.8
MALKAQTLGMRQLPKCGAHTSTLWPFAPGAGSRCSHASSALPTCQGRLPLPTAPLPLPQPPPAVAPARLRGGCACMSRTRTVPCAMSGIGI